MAQSEKAKISIPIRLKIIFLILSALSASILFNLKFGTQLIQDDKVSYIYDYNLTQVKALSDAIEGQIDKVVVTGRTLSGAVQSEAASTREWADDVFRLNSGKFGIAYLALLRPEGQKLTLIREWGDSQNADQLLERLGWTVSNYESTGLLTGMALGDRLPVGAKFRDTSGKPVAMLALYKPNLKMMSLGKDMTLILFDHLGTRLLDPQSTKSDGSVTSDDIRNISQLLLKETFQSGVKDINFASGDYIVGYERIVNGQILAVSMASKEVAFAAARTLVQRSLVLGLSILFVAIGVTLLFVRSLTTGLRQMWTATQKVAQGDFSSRVNLKSSSRDEITDLAVSFNTMADKIDELMVQTAQKARMEKELETAQTVQSRFFPSPIFEGENIKLAGSSVPATECAGDWWYHEKVGDYLIIAVGDVTGHGVSAALVTAAAHGAFSILMKMYKRKTQIPSVRIIMDQLNTAILAASGGDSTMTMLVMVANLSTGKMEMANAAHRAPYLYRASGANPKKRYTPLVSGQCDPLGQGENVEVTPAEYVLEAGDMIFLYTDGLLECTGTDGKRLSKLNLVGMLDTHYTQLLLEGSFQGGNILKELFRFFGDGTPRNLEDDITAIVCLIPPQAQFKIAA